MIPTPAEIRSIYAGIEQRPGIGPDLSGWNSRTPIFDEVIRLTRPKVLIEVGVWNGASVVHMGNICRQNRFHTTIFAVDVFYGRATEQIASIPPTLVPPRWDTPSRYEQFLFNVKKAGLDDCVVPIVNFSRHAAVILKAKGIVADAIYIDAGHDDDFAFEDMDSYWPLIRSGGKMFGDDIVGYGGVLSALGRFCKKHGVSIGLVGGQWFIDKP